MIFKSVTLFDILALEHSLEDYHSAFLFTQYLKIIFSVCLKEYNVFFAYPRVSPFIPRSFKENINSSKNQELNQLISFHLAICSKLLLIQNVYHMCLPFARSRIYST